MKRFLMIVVVVLLAGCGGGGSSDSGPTASGGIGGIGGEDSTLSSFLTFVKLTNSQTGNPLTDGTVKVFVTVIDFSVEQTDTGNCCSASFGKSNVILGSGSTDKTGTFAFRADSLKMPKEGEFINYDFSNAPPSMDTPEEAQSLLFSLLDTLTDKTSLGYHASGDGPGFFNTTVKVTRGSILPTTQDKTISIGVNPI